MPTDMQSPLPVTPTRKTPRQPMRKTLRPAWHLPTASSESPRNPVFPAMWAARPFKPGSPDPRPPKETSMIRYSKPMYFMFVLALVVCAFGFGHLPIDAGHLALGAIALNTTAFPINPELTAIAIAFKNPESQLIADLVLPRIPVAKKFTYTVYDESQGFTVPDTKIGRRSE